MLLTWLVEGIVGLSVDGQYIHKLKISTQLIRLLGVPAPRPLVVVWDGAHLLELAVSDALKTSTLSKTVESLSQLIVYIGHGKSFEALVEVSGEDEFLKPRAVKTMKFIGHTGVSINNFMLEYEKVISALKKLKDDPKHEVTASGYIRKFTSLPFILNLQFLRDLINFLTVFSKLWQCDQSTISDWYNTSKKLIKVLELLQDMSNVAELKNCMPNYAKELEGSSGTPTSSINVPAQRTLRSTYKTLGTSEETEATIKKSHRDFLSWLCGNIEARFSSSFVPSYSVIEDGAALLNNLVEETLVLNEKLVLCGHCGAVIEMKKQKSHHKRCHEKRQPMVTTLTTQGFSYKTSVDFSLLAKLLPQNVYPGVDCRWPSPCSTIPDNERGIFNARGSRSEVKKHRARSSCCFESFLLDSSY